MDKQLNMYHNLLITNRVALSRDVFAVPFLEKALSFGSQYEVQLTKVTMLETFTDILIESLSF